MLRKLIFLGAFTAIILGGTGFYFLTTGTSDGAPKPIVIRRGMAANQVATLLAEEGVISNPLAFKILLRLTAGDKKIRAGEFPFREGMSLKQAMAILYFDDGITHTVTVPEGYNARQIAQLLADQKLADSGKFLELVMNPQAPTKYKIKAPSLEGYLYPDTYKFSVIDGEDRILDAMVQQFFLHFTPEHKARAEAAGFTMEQVVTLASIVEKETGVKEERPLVSSVFHNRLKKKMRLQSDPTTIYGITDFNGNLTKADLLRPTPYNTYTISGLPPGAIASPGILALEATINPAQSEFLYFVANKTGGHVFSKSYGEHSQHVDNYQKKRKGSAVATPPARRPAAAVVPSSKKSKKKAKR